MDTATSAQPLPGIDAEQFVLPGFAPVQPPLLRVIEPLDETPPEPGPDQLRLGAEQQILAPVPEQPRQLPLIDEPLIFEQIEPPARPKGRLAKKRARAGITPGQGTLF